MSKRQPPSRPRATETAWNAGLAARAITVFALSLAVAVVSVAGSQNTGPHTPALVIRSMSGQDLFGFYCATCHGHDARGNGPVAGALKTAPADLTILARRNGGRFPRERVEAFITNGGDTLSPAHGSTAMPVWGPIFRGLDPSGTRVKVRIANLVQYLASIQAKQ